MIQIKKIHKEIWQNIFEIIDEDNQHHDRDTERRVKKYLTNNTDKITPYQTTDIRRLWENLGIDQFINFQEINKNKINENKHPWRYQNQ